MSYEPLHHKYRPQRFSELVGQEAIATTLTNALRQQRIAPAYLLTGPRGTGKTSSARILAKSLNCQSGSVPTAEPCGVCEICRAIATGSALDVIEIDAASNTGVDNIRDLIERAQFAPVQCRFKVYIIDEVHMLSTAAFNALLKTLEEPPNQVVFVLATTDPQRVLPTIISRCQRFDFRRIPLMDMVQHLGAIAQTEGIAIRSDAVELVAQVAQGGLRDAESLLDQLSLLDGEITVDRVWDLVGAVPERDLLALVQAIVSDDSTATLDCARHLMNRGREPLIVLQNLAGFYRDLLVAKTAGDRRDLVTITETTWADMVAFARDLDLGGLLSSQQHLRTSELQVKNTTQPRLWLEVTLMGLLPSSLNAQMPTRVAQPAMGQSTNARKSAGHAALDSSVSTSSPLPASAPATAPASASDSIPKSGPPAAAEIPPPPAQRPVSPSQSVAPAVSHSAPFTSASPRSAQTTQPAATPSTANATDPPPLQNLRQIWQQIIENLHPLSRALMRDHGQLVRFDQNQVEISMSNKNLLKIAQSRLQDIEKAFQTVAARKVNIVFVVSTTDDIDASLLEPTAAPSSTPSGRSPNDGQQPQPLRAPLPQSQSASQPAIADSTPCDRSTATDPDTSVIPPPPPAVTSSAAPDAASRPPGESDDGYVMPTWGSEDEVAQAAKSFAQMFNGEIVDLDDDFLPSPADSSSSTSASSKEVNATNDTSAAPTSAPLPPSQMSRQSDDDVPF